MNSFVRFVIDNGGSEYDLMYPQHIFKGKYCSSNTSCVWYKDELLVNTRLVEYIKLFQGKNFRVLDSRDNAQTYFYLKNKYLFKKTTNMQLMSASNYHSQKLMQI